MKECKSESSFLSCLAIFFCSSYSMRSMPVPAALPVNLQLLLSSQISQSRLPIGGIAPPTSTPAMTRAAGAAPPSALSAVGMASAVITSALLCFPSIQSTGSSAFMIATAVNVQCSLAMGEGLTSLPSKLVEKIKALKYIETSQLLPESWLLQHGEHVTSSGASDARRAP